MTPSIKSLAPLCAGFGGLLLLIVLVIFGGAVLAKGSHYTGAGGRFSGWPGTGGSAAQRNEAAKAEAPPVTTPPPTSDAPASAAGGAQANLLPWPFRITSEFGQYPNGQPHYGLDLDATYGVIQTAPVGGTVEEVLRGCGEGEPSCGNGWGNHVWWKSAETGHHILLAHFSKLEDGVQVGATVTAGQALGVTGATGYSTGPHVHVQVNTERCCENPGSINAAWEFPWLRCGEPVLGGRFGAACSDQ